jgi:hypothetical protein
MYTYGAYGARQEHHGTLFPHDENWLRKTANQVTPKKEEEKKGGVA